MEGVSSVTGGSTVNPQVQTSGSGNSSVDYDAFLSLLVTQLKNQDPTEPTDNAELMSQLASFSSVEQQVQINEKLDTLISSNVLGDASNLIGKTITSADGSITGKVVSIIIASDGIIAELEDGSNVAVLAGTKITDPDPEAPVVLSSVLQSDNGDTE